MVQKLAKAINVLIFFMVLHDCLWRVKDGER